MPPPSSRMTKQPVRPARYFPGRAYGPDPTSDDEEDEDDDEDEEAEEQAAIQKAPPPKAASFPSKANLAVGTRPAPVALPIASQPNHDDLEGFVTASESSEEGSEDSGTGEGESESEEEAEEESSDDEPKRPMLAPKFISKAKRAQQAKAAPTAEEQGAEEERLRKTKADEMLQAQLERDAAIRAAGKKYWDDDDVAPEDEVDDTDNVDPEGEKAAWKLRELRRVQRDRAALIEKEREREEVERRRNMTAEEREKADSEFLAQQAEEREARGKMAYMQRYHHKGAFFGGSDDQDEEVKAALNRDFAGARFEDDTGDKAVLPEYMRIRDMSKLGKKGRTKYRDLRSEDTGRWGQFEGRRTEYDGLDERFRPDERRDGGQEKTGANTAPLGERRRRDDEAGREEKRARYD